MCFFFYLLLGRSLDTDLKYKFICMPNERRVLMAVVTGEQGMLIPSVVSKGPRLSYSWFCYFENVWNLSLSDIFIIHTQVKWNEDLNKMHLTRVVKYIRFWLGQSKVYVLLIFINSFEILAGDLYWWNEIWHNWMAYYSLIFLPGINIE